MKTKLLRKVRKEFKIEYWPNGHELYPTPFIQLIYRKRAKRFFVNEKASILIGSYRTKEEAIRAAHKALIKELRDHYPHLGSYRKKFTKQQIWP